MHFNLNRCIVTDSAWATLTNRKCYNTNIDGCLKSFLNVKPSSFYFDGKPQDYKHIVYKCNPSATCSAHIYLLIVALAIWQLYGGFISATEKNIYISPKKKFTYLTFQTFSCNSESHFIYICIQGRPLGGAAGAVAPGPAPRDERNPPPPPHLPPSVTRSQKDRGGPHSIPRTGPRVSQGRPCMYIYSIYL